MIPVTSTSCRRSRRQRIELGASLHKLRRAAELEYTEPGAGAVYQIDIATLIRFDIVALDDAVTFLGRRIRARGLGTGGYGWNIVSHFVRVIGIAHIERTYARIEVTDKYQF